MNSNLCECFMVGVIYWCPY